MTIFTIYYRTDGTIESYCETLQLPSENETPKGCKRLCLDRLVSIWDQKSFVVNVKVDPATLHLVPINAPKIVTPEMEEAANQPVIVADPNQEIKHVPQA